MQTRNDVWLLIALLAAASSVGAQPSRRAELIQTASKNFGEALAHLERVDGELDRKAKAHQIIRKRIDSSSPTTFVKGLTFELNILVSLIEANRLIADEVKAAQTLATGGTTKRTYRELYANLSVIDSVLAHLQETLGKRQSARQDFKARLDKVIDAMILAEPDATGTFITTKVELDPDILDLEITQQRLILTEVIIPLKLLK